MSSQALSDIDRRALWEAHRKRCVYCEHPVSFGNLEIDHLIPEAIGNDAKNFEQIRTVYGLGADFEISGYANLAPSCRRCNADKLASLLPAARTAIILAKLDRRIGRVHTLRRKYSRLAGADEVIVGLLTALQMGALSIADVTLALERYDRRGDGRVALYRKLEFLDGTSVADLHKDEADRLLDIPVKLGTELPEGVEMVNARGEIRRVRTTREYRDAVLQDFSPSNNFFRKMADFFELPLGVITAIQCAQPARISFVCHPRIGIGELEYLPLWLLPYLAQPPKERDCTTLEDVKTAGHLIVKSNTPFSLEFEYQGMERHLVEIMRSDLNADGVEDLLVFMYTRSIGGTFAVAYTIAVTRKSPTGLFEPILGISRRFDSGVRFWREHT